MKGHKGCIGRFLVLFIGISYSLRGLCENHAKGVCPPPKKGDGSVRIGISGRTNLAVDNWVSTIVYPELT